MFNNDQYAYYRKSILGQRCPWLSSIWKPLTPILPTFADYRRNRPHRTVGEQIDPL